MAHGEEIKVHVLRKPGRKILYMRYPDPLTGQDVTRSTGATKQRDADRKAGEWEAELLSGRYKPRSRITWEEFKQRFIAEKLSSTSVNYSKAMFATFGHFEKLGVDRLAKITSSVISRFQASMRQDGITESTIRTYLKHLKAALRWGANIGLLVEVPRFEMPARARTKSQMKGRAVTRRRSTSVAALCSIWGCNQAAWG